MVKEKGLQMVVEREREGFHITTWLLIFFYCTYYDTFDSIVILLRKNEIKKDRQTDIYMQMCKKENKSACKIKNNHWRLSVAING